MRTMTDLMTPRRLFFALAAVSALAMGFALFLQRGLLLEPCPLCITQRVFVIAFGLLALAAAVHNPAPLGRRVYAGLGLLLALGGAAVAARHVWLQSLPEGLAPACGPSLAYMLETLPIGETIRLVFMGDGNCAEKVWSFLGLSIPQQTLILFSALALASAFQLLRRS